MKRSSLPLVTILLVLGHALVSHGEDNMTGNAIKSLISAIKSTDINAFRGCLTPDFATDMTPQAVAALLEPIAPRMAAGYTLTDLGSLKQGGMAVHIYRIEVSDGGDDILLRAILENDQVAGLLITAPFE